jgi:hypothetical protein
VPYLANGQNALFFPFNFPFYLINSNYNWLVDIFVAILKIFFGGIFFYLFLKSFGLSEKACLFATVAFIFNTQLLNQLGWAISNVVYAIPFSFFAIRRFICDINRNNFIILTFAWSLQYFAGYIQLSVYLIFFAFLYAVVEYFERFKNLEIKNKIFLEFALFLATFFLGTGIASICLFPLLEYIPLSQTLGERISNVCYAIPLPCLITFIFPHYFGTDTTLDTYYTGMFSADYLVYIGLLPFFMAIYAFWFFYTGKIRGLKYTNYLFFFTLSTLAMFLYIYRLPFIGNISYFFKIIRPQRLSYLLEFFLCILSGFGINFFISKYTGAQPGNKRTSILIFVFIFILSVLYYFLFTSDIIFIHSPKKRALLHFSIILFLFLFPFLFMRTKKLSARLLFNLFIIITCVDLLILGSRINLSYLKKGVIPKNQVIDFLLKKSNGYRIGNLDDEDNFAPNLHLLYDGLYNIRNYDGLQLKSYELFTSRLFRSDFPFVERLKLSAFMGTKYIFTKQTISDNEAEAVFSLGELKLYEIKTVNNRVFYLKDSVVAKVNNKDYAIPIKIFSQFDLAGDILGIEDNLNSIIIQLLAKSEGYLILLDNYYPGWRVYVDKDRGDILRINANFRAVKLKSGFHKIEFQYMPFVWRLGLIIMLFSLVCGLCFFVFFKRIKKWMLVKL